MTLFLISLIPYLIFTIFKTKKSLHMLQQNFYDDDCRYFKWILANITKIAYESDILFILIICTLFFDIGVTIGAFIILYGLIFISYRKKKVEDTKNGIFDFVNIFTELEDSITNDEFDKKRFNNNFEFH